VWYGKSDPSATSAVAGTYKGDEAGILAILIMKADHTFEQTVAGSGKSAQSGGTWSQDQHGDILFSKEFLKGSGYSLNESESARAMNPGASNFLQIEIAASPKFGRPTFCKEQFPWY
jgi:hypothetical protein